MTAPNSGFFENLRTQFGIFRELSKSGIVALVLISVLGGYFIGQPSETDFHPTRLLLALIGILFLASGSSALNQFQERKIDAEMPRTANRPLPSGRLSSGGAMAFILITTLLGLSVLYALDPGISALGVLAVVSYNGLYTLWWKKRWAFAAVPGAIPGALPILMGYAAAAGNIFAPAGIYLFFILFFWQMPHFWVLALKFKADYAAGGIPTLPVAKGSGITVFHIQIWCLAYVALAMIAPLFLKVGVIYLVVAILVSISVLRLLWVFSKAPESGNWLKFFLGVNFSLILYLAAAAIDLWSIYLIPYFNR